MPACPLCATAISDLDRVCPGCGNPVAQPAGSAPLSAEKVSAFEESLAAKRDSETVERIASYEKLSGILWLVVAVLQILTCVGAVAGAWNLYASVTRLKLVKHVRARRSFIPEVYKPYAQLVVLGLINLFLGGILGVAFVLFDFYVRDQVLQNARLFDQE